MGTGICLINRQGLRGLLGRWGNLHSPFLLDEFGRLGTLVGSVSVGRDNKTTCRGRQDTFELTAIGDQDSEIVDWWMRISPCDEISVLVVIRIWLVMGGTTAARQRAGRIKARHLKQAHHLAGARPKIPRFRQASGLLRLTRHFAVDESFWRRSCRISSAAVDKVGVALCHCLPSSAGSSVPLSQSRQWPGTCPSSSSDLMLKRAKREQTRGQQGRDRRWRWWGLAGIGHGEATKD